MSNALPTQTFSYIDGSELVVSEFHTGLVLPNNSVKVRLNQTTVHLNQPAFFTSTGPAPTNFLASIKEGIRVLELAAEALQGRHSGGTGSTVVDGPNVVVSAQSSGST